MIAIFRIIKQILLEKRRHLNLLKTIYFNFRVFDFADAVIMPVYLYGNVKFEGLKKGCVDLKMVKRKCVIIGGGWYTDVFGYAELHRTFIRIKGKLSLGTDVKMHQGCVISVNKNAILEVGDNVIINMNTKIHAKKRITIEDNCRIGWNSQIFDTNFHYMIKDGKIRYRNAPVLIGHNTWIANGVSIMKGTSLPAYSVVAGNSVVNKDYMHEGEKCFFAGVPAKCLAHGVERILGNEMILDEFFTDEKDLVNYEDVKDRLK